MCGIVGIWRHDGGPAEIADIGRMLDTIVHRGPDDHGTWQGGRAALGLRRLAIIDLSSAGHQPMVTPDGMGVLAYNGEVYNFRDLRRELEREGVSFRGVSDSEVVLHALHRWGPERAIPLFNGMFGLAYLDRRTETLWLARDRLGIKPLYTADTGRELIFASEVKALLAHPRFAAKVSNAALAAMFLAKPRSHQSFFDGVIGLRSGTWWKVTRQGIEKHRYYHAEEALDVDRLATATRRGDMTAAIAAFRGAFATSVGMHLVSDAPVAAMCSGGVDSSLIAAVAADTLPGMPAYVADAPPGGGEAAQAERVACHVGIPIRKIGVDQETYLRLLPLVIRHLDGPSYHPSDPALFAVTRACRADGIKVLLTGEGADELFGGYSWVVATYRRWRPRALLERFAPFLASRRTRRRWHSFPAFAMASENERAVREQITLATGDADVLIAQRVMERLSPACGAVDAAFIGHSTAELYRYLSYILHRHDHMGMAASIEMRVPFVENGMLDLALHLPRKARVQGRQGKWAEKMAAAERLPRDIVFAPKRGFPVPASYTRGAEQLLRGGLLAGQLEWTAAATEFFVAGLYQNPDLRSQVISAEIWLRLQLGGETVETLGERLVAMTAGAARDPRGRR